MKFALRMKMKWSESEPEVEIQYGRRLFSETGNSYIPAIDWPINSKIGTQANFDVY